MSRKNWTFQTIEVETEDAIPANDFDIEAWIADLIVADILKNGVSPKSSETPDELSPIDDRLKEPVKSV